MTTVVNAWLAGKYRDTRLFDKSEVYGIFKSCLRSEFDGDLERILADVADYSRKIIGDADFRSEELEDAERWVSGKPKELISEYKMFGD